MSSGNGAGAEAEHRQDAGCFSEPDEGVASGAEEPMQTPSPACKRAMDQDEHTQQPEATPGPVAKRRRTTPREKAAQALAADLEKANSTAEALAAQAAEAAVAAETALRAARALAARADALKVAAEEAKEKAESAKRAAERAQLETTQEGRAAAREQDKAEKKAAKEAQRLQKLREQQQAAACRSKIKDIGDAIKDSMVISKRGGMWEVPPGNVTVRHVPFSTFQTLFSRGRCAFTPVNYCEADPTISVVTKDAASIFGSTKVRGGSMYATFVITSMRVTYVPASKLLTIAYKTDMGF